MFLTLIMFLEESTRLFCLISLKVAYTITISGYSNSVSPKSIDETGNRYTAVGSHSPPLPSPHAMLHMQNFSPAKAQALRNKFRCEKAKRKISKLLLRVAKTLR